MPSQEPARERTTIIRAADPGHTNLHTSRLRAGLRTLLTRGLQLSLGLGLGLCIAEGALWLRDDGSFPHVNFYEADPELGVRLRPYAKMRFRLGDNPTRTINVNAQGFRGPDWPPLNRTEPDADDADDADDAIMVFGDSQVFGLGVADDETFSARLAEYTGRPVFNAGVPTYGPPEYLALADRLLAERKVDTVIYVLNFLNDPFELDRPNIERHAVWDGWAVRIETAPAPGEVQEFPGREWLMSRSHLVYAARRAWHEREQWAATAGAGLPSEGRWDDLLGVSESARAAEEARVAALELARQEANAATSNARQARHRVESRSDELSRISRALATIRPPQERKLSRFEHTILRRHPGDIVHMSYGEGSRKVVITAQMYDAAIVARHKHEVNNAERQRKYEARREGLEARRARLLAQIKHGDGREQLAVELEQLAVELAVPPPPPRAAFSVFEPHLREVAATCERHGAELLVIALPFDVQVSSTEWAKYGVADGPDMTGTRVLLEDLVLDAEALGIHALEATAALRAAEPGAFLDGDIHMTAKGHAALTRAIVPALENMHGSWKG